MNNYIYNEKIAGNLNITYMSEEKYYNEIYKLPYRNCNINTINLTTFDSKIADIYFLKEENKNIINKKCDIFILDSSCGLSNLNSDMVKKIISKNEALYNKPVCGIYTYNFFLENKYVQIANLYYAKNGNIIEKEDIILPHNTHGVELLNISLLEIEELRTKQKIKK